MIEVIECAQGSPEWYYARAGVITASNFKLLRERLKSGPNKGDWKAEAKAYAFKLAIERISGEPLADDQFETFAMRRGHELEPTARLKHEERIGMIIEHAGVVRTPDGLFGASADGLILEDGGAEYKCFVDPSKLRSIIVDNDWSDLQDQVQGCLWITGRKWWHMALYCPALEDVGKDLIIHEARRDDNYIDAMEADLLAFNELVEEYRQLVLAAPDYRPAEKAMF